jgi:hypothetical protein
VDISEDEFYDRLVHDPIHPGTSQPTPNDFAFVYRKLAEEADGIISIHISSKLSGTCSSAFGAKQLVDSPCPIEVIDSLWTSIALGYLAMRAAAGAKAGKGMQELMALKKSVGGLENPVFLGVSHGGAHGDGCIRPPFQTLSLCRGISGTGLANNPFFVVCALFDVDYDWSSKACGRIRAFLQHRRGSPGLLAPSGMGDV